MTEPKESEEEAQQEPIVEREQMKQELEQLKKEQVWASIKLKLCRRPGATSLNAIWAKRASWFSRF